VIYFTFVIGVLMGVGSLTYAYSGAGYELLVRALLAIGAFWLYVGWRRWAWASSVIILLLVAAAGYGLWFELPPGWMIAGALGALLAWDLSEFMRRLAVAPKSDDLPGMKQRHLARVTIVALLGVLLASISMLVRLEFTLEWIMLLTLVAVLGVTQLVAWLRRGG
jgi:hypothetical protein